MEDREVGGYGGVDAVGRGVAVVVVGGPEDDVAAVEDVVVDLVSEFGREGGEGSDWVGAAGRGD